MFTHTINEPCILFSAYSRSSFKPKILIFKLFFVKDLITSYVVIFLTLGSIKNVMDMDASYMLCVV
jgi:hypothetical protein